MASYDTWQNILTGISQGTFDKIYIRDSNGNMTDILTLISGSGGAVTSAVAPLSITNGVLMLDLSNIMATSHEANKIGSADVDFGLHYVSCSDITLYDHSGNGAHTVLATDNSGNLIITDSQGSGGAVTVPYLNQWTPLSLDFQDGCGKNTYP